VNEEYINATGFLSTINGDNLNSIRREATGISGIKRGKLYEQEYWRPV
jgi:hypothetical protein